MTGIQDSDGSGVRSGTAVPLGMDNVDTDMIIPRQFLKTVSKAGLGAALFHDYRYSSDGCERDEFILNRPDCRHGTILLAGANFACGSAREHACWALRDFGFRVVVAESFSSFFYSNCFHNDLVPVVLPGDVIRNLIEQAHAMMPAHMLVDVRKLHLRDSTGREHGFELPAYQREKLVSGRDEIEMSLGEKERVVEVERRLRNEEPWRFSDLVAARTCRSAGV